MFGLLVALLLVPLGGWLLIQDRRGALPPSPRLSCRAIVGLGFAAGLVGGIYGIGGGSLVAPVLVGCGSLAARVAPAALLATFATSCVGAATYAVLALIGKTEAQPDWLLGVACGLGGLVGGYVGAALQPRLPQRGLRLLLGAIAVALSVVYLVTYARA